MHYTVLASDYDGTLARNGRVSEQTIEALERFIASGRHVLLVTGRRMEDVRRDFSRLDLFTYIVAEDGAVLYHPASATETPLGEPPPAQFIRALHESGATPIVVGRVIVATVQPYETIVLEKIREFGLERQIIFNKGSVMVLPTGINKGVGVTAALRELGIEPRLAVGVGDAENDHSLLAACGFAAAVNNALPALKEQADSITRGEDGEGIRELIELILADKLAKSAT